VKRPRQSFFDLYYFKKTFIKTKFGESQMPAKKFIAKITCLENKFLIAPSTRPLVGNFFCHQKLGQSHGRERSRRAWFW